ncbi:aldehyde dehydrogenase [Tepiditoga spiralis]|uniref:Aldehyde dehydrogenase n=2 Tax=Tepiditoga spiralis TaxID=2108365 RepID=A0A7G1G8V2_9BACT|nr:aldehyde dehydrogenase [Tepiditoga spiralis]BBE31866.1 aldehyde dehydrogenase [Tepiditoga spiralis]
MNNKELQNMLLEMKEYFFIGKTKDVNFRIEQLKKLKKSIIKYTDEIIVALEKDLGRHKYETYAAEIGTVLKSINYSIKNIKKWSKVKKVKTPLHLFSAKSYINPEPYGVVLIIGPFNYPFNLLIEPMIGAITAGNTVVIKPSEDTPNVSKVINKIISENYDFNYIRVVEGEKEIVSNLINMKFDFIFFTGSVKVGKIIMEAASKNLTPVTLELGGKSPCIVDKTANIKVSAKRIAWGKCFNAGQTCVAPDYLIIHKSVKEQFIKEFKQAISNFYGHEIEKSKDYARIINEKQMNRLIKIIEEDKSKVIFGGEYNLKEKYISPTLLNNVNWNDASMKDEIFGPLLPILEYENIEDVSKIINERPKPLAVYIFSESKNNQKYIIENTSSGGFGINETVSHFTSHYMPFGGVGNSGLGSYHGEASFRQFSHFKSILNKSTKINLNVQFPPYTEKKFKLVKKILK